jgi:hypothetical protein
MFNRTKSGTIEHIKTGCSEYFSLEPTKAMFKEMSKAIPSAFSPNITSKETFAYYSLVALAVISVS